ncbi:MAG: hypothetical protein WD579_02975 [Candidatus Paceibacterota bacterium]
MLIVIYGTDFRKTRKKLTASLVGLQKKRPDAEMFELNDETFDPARFEELLGGQGLFERKNIVVLDRVFSSKEGKEVAMASCKEIGESENVFILHEPSLKKKEVDKLEKHAYSVYEFNKKISKEKEYKPFGLSDAVGRRDIKKAWNELNRAWSEGKLPEEIHGLLFWQLKSMIVASSTKSANEAGMKAFVYNKARKGASNYTIEELHALSRNLIERYHEARRGAGELTTHIEKFILNLKGE